jgi:hypothetical protein
MKSLKSSLPLLVISILFFTACKSSQQRKAEMEEKYGYISDEVRNLETIKAYASKWGIPEESFYVLDLKDYDEEIFSYQENNKRLTHDLYQWHQLMVFNQSDHLLSYQLNCTTKRVDNNWQWNYEGTFDQYPPQDKSVKKYQKELKLSNISPFFKDLSNTSFSEKIKNDTDIVIVAFWTIYHGKQSRNLIEEVLKYRKTHADKKVQFVFLNHSSDHIKNEIPL